MIAYTDKRINAVYLAPKIMRTDHAGDVVEVKKNAESAGCVDSIYHEQEAFSLSHPFPTLKRVL